MEEAANPLLGGLARRVELGRHTREDRPFAANFKLLLGKELPGMPKTLAVTTSQKK